MYNSFTPYVQNVSKWIQHYNPAGNADPHVSVPNDNPNSGETTGLAQEGQMAVSQVESSAPPMKVPHTSPNAALRTVSSSQATVQQAAFDAKRDEILSSESAALTAAGSKKKKSGNKSQISKGRKVQKTKRVNNKSSSLLLGTPADIFKSKTVDKKKKKR